MIVKKIDDLKDTKNETVLVGGQAVTRRFLLREDDVGFTVSEITVDAGQEADLWYKNHIEANYVIEGEGTLTNKATGEVHELRPGVPVLPRQARPAPGGGEDPHARRLHLHADARPAVNLMMRTGSYPILD